MLSGSGPGRYRRAIDENGAGEVGKRGTVDLWAAHGDGDSSSFTLQECGHDTAHLGSVQLTSTPALS